jgi:hypothetical protein
LVLSALWAQDFVARHQLSGIDGGLGATVDHYDVDIVSQKFPLVGASLWRVFPESISAR